VWMLSKAVTATWSALAFSTELHIDGVDPT
jgi:hypothetical protein